MPAILPRPVKRKVEKSLTYLVVSTVFIMVAVGLFRGGLEIARLEPESVTLSELPYAITLSFLRMLASYLGSLAFAFLVGMLAARTEVGERVLIPVLDLGQSIPIVAFFPAAIGIFIGIVGRLSDGQRLGVELAACFLIFTSQVWNLAFAVYEAIKKIPTDHLDAIDSLGVVGSAKFKNLYAPVCVPPLVYNSILSWSNGWYFLVACEIIAVGPAHYHLPGIGSFLARAAQEERISLVLWGLLALSVTILAIDAFVWRPLTAWSERFRSDSVTPDDARPSLAQGAFFLGRGTSIIPRNVRLASTRLVKILIGPVVFGFREILVPLIWDLPVALMGAIAEWVRGTFLPGAFQWFLKSRLSRPVFWTLGSAIFFFALARTAYWLRPPWPDFASEIPTAILFSTGRIVVGLLVSLAWTLPLVLWVWDKPRIREALTTIAQVGASLPAIALFPLVVILAIRKLGGGMEVSSLFLLVTGMQWYLLFNLLSGAAGIPYDLAEAARSMGLSRRQVWKRLVLPAMRPSLVTGLITAWGGGWNALVVSEYVLVKNEKLTVSGIGALVSRAVFEMGDHRSVALCVTSMIVWILLFNSLLWKPMMARASERYRMDL